MAVETKSYLTFILGVSFLGITFLITGSEAEHEGHDHRSQHMDTQDDRILADDERHDAHGHENHVDHLGHGHEKEHEKNQVHERHSGQNYENANKGHADHSHEDGGHKEHWDEVTLTDEAIKYFKLRIDTVRRTKLIPRISAPARVTFNEEKLAHVGSSVSGRVKEIQYRIGDHVQKGDILLVVDSPELGQLQSEFLQKRIEAQVAEISLEVAEAEYERAKKLIEGNGISQAQFLKAERNYKVAEGGQLTAMSNVQALENRLQIFGISKKQIEALIQTEKIDFVYQITAPISGEIIARKATIGEVVKPDDHALMIIADLATIWIIASVPEGKTPVIRVGAPAYYNTEFPGGERLKGKVSYIAPALDERTRTGQVRIEVSNKERLLRPGMFGTVLIDETTGNMDTYPEVLSVPNSAVFTVEGGPAVFVPSKKKRNTFEKRAVVIGPTIDGNVVVASGLDEGELYVAKGGFILKAELGKEGVAHEH